jgi:predicted SnoaL-like aldol condensation-catalyzing enzyme
MRSIVRFAVAAAGAVVLLGTGAAFAAETKQEKANTVLVTSFWREVLQAQNPAAASKYYATDIIQHNPNVPSGLAGFQEFFGRLWKTPKPVKAEIDPPPAVVMAHDDLVLIVNKHTGPDPADASKTYDSFWFDLFRVKDGKIVEHWDNAVKNPPRPPTP